MKYLIALSLALVLACAGVVFAGGGLPWTRSKTLIQNMNGQAPELAKSGCVTTMVTKGTIQGQYSTLTGSVDYEAEVVDSAGAAVPVKWEVDGKQIAYRSSLRLTNSGADTYSKAIQRAPSSASRSLTSCTRMR